MKSLDTFRGMLEKLKERFGRIAANPKLEKPLAAYRAKQDMANAFIQRTPALKAIFHIIPPKLAVAILVLGLGFGIWLYNWHKNSVVHTQHVYADIRRISNMEQIRIDIRQYSLSKGKLPKSLKELESDGANPNFIRDDYFYDPETLRPMEYKMKSPDEYTLCTYFNFDSKVIKQEVPDSGVDRAIWQHNPGYRCFEFSVSVGGP